MTEKPHPARVVQQVERQGAVCVQGFFDAEAVAAMRSESVALLDRPVEGVSPCDMRPAAPAGRKATGGSARAS